MTLKLPEKGTYRVELLDTMEMTRNIVRPEAHGVTRLPLPGKESMAVLVPQTAEVAL